MKILGISGSPRKGNTDYMLNIVLNSAKENKANTDLTILRELKIENCDGCGVCFDYNKPCHIKDDFYKVLNKMLDSDVILWGSPNYFKNVSGLMKNFMDRTNEIIKKFKLKGKYAAFVCVGGQSIDNTRYCRNVMYEFIKDHKMNLIGEVIAKAEFPKDIEKNPRVIKECIQLGEKIARGR